MLRFRHDEYALTADMESMYNYITVPVCDIYALRFLWFEDGVINQFRMTPHLFGGSWCSSSSGYACPSQVSPIQFI